MRDSRQSFYKSTSKSTKPKWLRQIVFLKKD